ncbi:MAG: 50S ribosomal protein L31e [Candidatus Micrarchaeota archaeon]
MADKLERIYTVPLGGAYDVVRNRRARRAVKLLKSFLEQHMKADGAEVSVSNALNAYIWKSGIQKPPRRVKVRAIKENSTVKAYLHDEKIEEKKKEEPKKEAKPAEKPAENAVEKKPESEKKEKALPPEGKKAEPKKEEPAAGKK